MMRTEWWWGLGGVLWGQSTAVKHYFLKKNKCNPTPYSIVWLWWAISGFSGDQYKRCSDTADRLRHWQCGKLTSVPAAASRHNFISTAAMWKDSNNGKNADFVQIRRAYSNLAPFQSKINCLIQILMQCKNLHISVEKTFYLDETAEKNC